MIYLFTLIVFIHNYELGAYNEVVNNMSKLDEFKVFIKDQDEVLTKIHKGELTWQKVYEIYDIYGPSNSLFKQPKKETRSANNSQLNNALKAFQDIDMDKISNNLQSIQKVLGIFGEFSKNNKVDPSHSMSKGSYRRFND